MNGRRPARPPEATSKKHALSSGSTERINGERLLVDRPPFVT
jgi:hypothetical protein